MDEFEDTQCSRCHRYFRKGEHQYADRSDLFNPRPLCVSCQSIEHIIAVENEEDETG